MPEITKEERALILDELGKALGSKVTTLKVGQSLKQTVGGVEVTVTRPGTYYEVALKQGELSGRITIYPNEADYNLHGAEGVQLAHALRDHLPRLLTALLGEEKAKWLATYDMRDEPLTLALAGFGGVEVENPALSLECPPGLFYDMVAACTRLLETGTGKTIIKIANEKGVSFTIYYRKGMFQYAGDSDDPDKPVVRGKFFADPAAISGESAYLGVDRAVEGVYPLTPAPIRMAVVFGHEVVHAIHSMVSWKDYLRRGAARTDEDWTDLEEQLTITGWVKDEPAWEVSECHLLRDFGLPPRWGHGDAGSIKTKNVSEEQVATHYGPHWGKSYGVVEQGEQKEQKEQ